MITGGSIASSISRLRRRYVVELAKFSSWLEGHWKSALGQLVALALLAGVAWLTIARIQPPRPLPQDAPETDFSALRAVTLLDQLGGQPRPPGSLGHARALDLIVERFVALGIETEVQAVAHCVELLGRIRCANANNIVGRISGTQSTSSIVLAAHYDTVHNSPGISDDGAGVATLLETARALRLGAPLTTDVIFLVTDAEEAGLIGASAFVEEHRWAAGVDVMLNFEARGTHGTSAMFDSSRDNLELIRNFSEAYRNSSSNSVLAFLSRLLPNDTDASIFKRAGTSVMSFAYADGLQHYHRATDDLEHIDLGSLQHHGEQALALTRHLGNGDLSRLRDGGGEAVYFDVHGNYLVNYSKSIALGLAGLVLILWARQLRASTTSLARLRRAALYPSGMFLATLVVATGIELAAHEACPAGGYTIQGNGFLMANIAAVSGLYLLATRWILRILQPGDVWLATAGLWAAATVTTTIGAAGTSYVFAWSTIACLVASVILGCLKQMHSGWVSSSILVVGAIPIVFFTSYFVYLLFVMTGGNTIASALVFGCGLGLVLPYWLHGRSGRLLLSRAVGLGLVSAGVALFCGSCWKARSEKPVAYSGVDYVWNADELLGFWTSEAAAVGPFSQQYLGHHPIKGPWPAFGFERSIMRATASPHSQRRPELTVVHDITRNRQRHVRLRIHSARGARRLTIEEVTGVSIATQAVSGQKVVPFYRFSREADRRLWTWITGESLNRWNLEFENPAAAGFEVDIAFDSHISPTFLLKDVSDGLPALGKPLMPRPEGVVPAPWGDRTIVFSKYGMLEAP